MFNLENSIDRLEKTLKDAKERGIKINEEIRSGISLNFESQRKEVCKRLIYSSIKAINDGIWKITIKEKEKVNELVKDLNRFYKEGKIDEMLKILDLLKLFIPKNEEELKIAIPPVPQEIKEEISLDIEELKKCYQNGCYRSAIILCGRLLEIALHKKYYDLTGVDYLEKNPGIGLGKIVAKLSELNVNIDPAITQQIHLINQVRISSVHKKKVPFKPTKEQTKAIIIYTIEIIKNLFS